MSQLADSVSKAFDEKREELRAQLADLDRAEAAALEALAGPRRNARMASVPDGKYEEIIAWLRRHPNTQQKEMVSALNINSGIISQAMTIALARKDVAVDRKGRGRGARYTAIYSGEPAGSNGRSY